MNCPICLRVERGSDAADALHDAVGHWGRTITDDEPMTMDDARARVVGRFCDMHRERVTFDAAFLVGAVEHDLLRCVQRLQAEIRVRERDDFTGEPGEDCAQSLDDLHFDAADATVRLVRVEQLMIERERAS